MARAHLEREASQHLDGVGRLSFQPHVALEPIAEEQHQQLQRLFGDEVEVLGATNANGCLQGRSSTQRTMVQLR